MTKQIRELVNLDPQPTLSSRQAQSVNKRQPRNTEGAVSVDLPAPAENDTLQPLLEAIKELGDGEEDFRLPDAQPVHAEWVGHRKNSKDCSPRHQSDRETYGCLVEDCSSSVLMMFVHGGGFL